MDLKNKIFPFILQINRFGIIGLLAAATQFFCVILFVHFFQVSPLIANVFSFLFAFQVSYWGHKSWTFQGTSISNREGMIRFLLVALTGFAINQCLFFLFLNYFDWSYKISLLIVIAIVACITFVFSRAWVFRFYG